MIYYVFALILLASWLLTGVYRRFAMNAKIIDIPNHRSAHQHLVPRGGGLVFVFLFLIATFFLAAFGFLECSIATALVVSGMILAFIGFMDDLGKINIKYRFLGQIALSIFALMMIQGVPDLICSYGRISSGFFLNILSLFYFLWLLNLYNFMDGIDGFAALEAVEVSVSICLIYYFTGYSAGIFAPIFLVAALGGFIYWNFPPAKLFMGDVGSGFLGFVLGILSIDGMRQNPVYFWSWLILLGVFIVDATVTLISRFFQGKKIYHAHASHLYQKGARLFKSHLQILIIVFLINTLWLFPFSFLVALGYLDGLIALLIAYVPLVILAVYFRAGYDNIFNGSQ